MNDEREGLIDCPTVANCSFGSCYPTSLNCLSRTRREDGLFECRGFKPIRNITLNEVPEPDIELFPEHDYGSDT